MVNEEGCYLRSFVAFLRGISPSNPKMRNEKLRSVFHNLGFSNVRTVISSGNVLFESEADDMIRLEGIIEKKLQEQLGITSTTIICSKEELKFLFNENPFKNIDDTPKSKLNVTFLKNEPENQLVFPYQSENKGFTVLSINDRVVFSVVDLSRSKTPDLMRWLEKEFGKNITTRTWKTIVRIIKKFDE